MDTKSTTPIETIRVLIVDDHTVVRQGLRTFLELQSDASWLPIEVVGEASNGAEAAEYARKLQPDIVLLDLVMPVMDGIEGTKKITQNSPKTKVIILTSFGEQEKVISYPSNPSWCEGLPTQGHCPRRSGTGRTPDIQRPGPIAS